MPAPAPSNPRILANPRILVIGATGEEGGSVARHLLAGGRFAVRALTRRPESRHARELASQGAEVVAGDLENRPSLRAALAGCYGVFGLTACGGDYERELAQGRNLLHVIAASEVEHLVLCTLPSLATLSGGRLVAPHVEAKAQLEALARELALPATFLHLGFYFERLFTALLLQPEAAGGLVLRLPQATPDEVPLAAIAVADLGGLVQAIFDQPAEHLGQALAAVADEIVPSRLGEELARTLGRPVAVQPLASLPADLALRRELDRLSLPRRRAEIARCRQLYPALSDLATWLAEHPPQLSPQPFS